MRKTLKNILDSQVKIDNTLMWDGHAAPFHEAYFLKINDPQNNWALWLKYELCNPITSQKNGVAALWGLYIDSNGEKQAIKELYELAKHDIVHADQFMAMGDSYLSLAEATGSIQNNSKSFKWELFFEDPVISTRIYPIDLFYHLSRPLTKFKEPRLMSFATGQAYINHKKRELKRLRVYQAHTYGQGFCYGWAWANCLQFKEDAEAYFEAYTLQTALGPKKIKQLHFFCLGFEGEQFYANSLIKMFTNKSELTEDSWKFSFSKSGYRFEGVIQRQPQLTFGLKEEGPKNEVRYRYISLMAQIEIKVYRRSAGKWQHYKTLTSQNSCSFETVSPKTLNHYALDLENEKTQN